MKKFFVIGNPIDHSLSPKLQNYWLKKNNVDAVQSILNDLNQENRIIGEITPIPGITYTGELRPI